MLTTDIRTSDVDEWRDHAGDLFQEHYREIALNHDVFRLDPNWKSYYELEMRGLLSILALWEYVGDASKTMIGYAVNIEYQHLHYASVKVIQNDLIFLRKSHRGTGLGPRLLDAAEANARIRGGHVFMLHAKMGTTLASMLGGRGFSSAKVQCPPGWQLQDLIFSKVLT